MTKPITKTELSNIAKRVKAELKLQSREIKLDARASLAELVDARVMARDARMAFGEFLSRPEWQWYVTQTFKDDYVPPKLGDKHYYAWLNSLALTCRIQGLPRPFYFRTSELQQRGSLHYHSLLGGVGEISRRLFNDFWSLNGFAKIEAYDANRGANFYVGKYLTKAEGDIRFSHNLTRHLTKANRCDTLKE